LSFDDALKKRKAEKLAKAVKALHEVGKSVDEIRELTGVAMKEIREILEGK